MLRTAEVPALVGCKEIMRLRKLTVVMDDEGQYVPAGFGSTFMYSDLQMDGPMVRVCVALNPAKCAINVYVSDFKAFEKSIGSTDIVVIFVIYRTQHISLVLWATSIFDWLSPITRRDILRDGHRHLSTAAKPTELLVVCGNDATPDDTSDNVDYF